MSDPDEELSGGAAAQVVGCTIEHLGYLGRVGAIPGKQVLGRYWVFRRGDLEAYRDAPKDKGGRPKSIEQSTTKYETPDRVAA